MKRTVVPVILLFWLLTAGALHAEMPPDRVTAVIPPDSPPTYFRDKKTGKPAGFAVDVLNALAERSGLRVDYRYENGWTTIIELVRKGEADLIPGMGVSKEREKDLAFTTPIDAFPISFFVRSEHPGIDASPGMHVVGVIRGSVAFENLHDRTGITLVLYEEFPQGLFDLLAGKIEAFACPAPTLWQLARETGVDDHVKVVDKPIAEITRSVAVRKDQRMLLNRLNEAIRGYVGSPAYQQIYSKWYGKQVPYWSERRIIVSAVAAFLVMLAVMAGWRYASVVRLNRELTAAAARQQQADAENALGRQRLESLVEIFQYDAKDLQTLLDFALEKAISLTGSKIGYLYFYNEEKREFTLNTWSRDVMKACSIADPQTIYHLDKTGIWGNAVRERGPIMLNDFTTPHPGKKGYPEGHASLHRFLSIPVIMQDRIVAVIGVANKPEDYEQNDIRQLTLLMDAVWVIADRKRAETELKRTLAEIKTLHGVLPICSSCKRIRDDKGSWRQLEAYISEHTESEFTHGLCLECARNLYPQYYRNFNESET